MKIAKRQLMGFLIALLFMCSSFVFVSNTAQAAMTQADYDSKVNGFINDARWRNGIWWGSGQPPKLSTYSCAECFAYACDFTKYVYGINSLRSGSKYTNISEIRQGDVVYMTGHYFVVLYRDGDYLYTAEGNNSSKVRIAKYGYKISNGRLYSVYGNSSYAQNFINGWHYTDIVSHTHSYASAITKQPTCTNTGIKTFTCSCGASYTESVPATGHKYVNTVVPPTTTDKGYTLHTCSVCGNSYKDSYTDPIYEEDGWYYTTVLPENVDSTSYDIQYKNYYEKIQQSSPGAGWVNAGLVESKWVNSGGTYEDYHTLQTSSSKVLVNYYYFHFCGPSAGSRVNYTLSSPYVHYDDIRNVNSVNVVSSGTDDDGTTIPYYILNWTNGQGAFCSSGTTCNGSNGTHGARSKVWYRMNVYQNRVQVNNYKFTKESDWVDAKDSTAKSTQIRYTLKNPLKAFISTDKSEASVGQNVTLRANATGGVTGYTYSFLVHNTDTNLWSRIQSFASNSTLVWKAGSAGNREFYVEVKDSTGKVTRSEAVKVKVSSALELTTKVDKSSLAVGEKLTVTGYGKGGSGNYTYSFLIHNTDTNEWYRIQSFKSNSSLEWTAGSAGNREFYVEVKDSTGKVTRSEAMKVKVSSSALGLTTKVDKSSLAVGEKLTVTGCGKGGSGNYTYSFLIHNTDTNQWCRVQSFTSNSTLVWTAGSAGNRNFYVEVKDTTGKVVRSEAIRVVTY